jgi:hypothetical protein
MNTTESEALKHYNRIGIIFTTISTIMGFAFWPLMVMWTSGEDLFSNMAEANIWFNLIVTSTMFATGLFGGLLAIALYKGHEPE